MKTLTITEAKKNLSRWLQEAAGGRDVAIISGDSIIALRKVEVEPVDYTYAMSEYGATPAELDRFEKAVDERFRQQRQAGKLMTMDQAEKGLGQAHTHRRRRL
jgi:antitoxin (DNA-binding transcriptional repressor) of toxin-antitoxin stability system